MDKCDELSKDADFDEPRRPAVVRGDRVTRESERCAERQSSVGEGFSEMGPTP